MLRFLLGVVVGVFLGVLVIAPNPQWTETVENYWTDAKVWAAALWSAAEDTAADVGDRAEEAVDETDQ
jgi:hypothetical protein